MADKHPTEMIQELDYSIMQIEKDIETLNKTLSYNIKQLEKLIQRKQSLLNYLNTDSVNTQTSTIYTLGK